MKGPPEVIKTIQNGKQVPDNSPRERESQKKGTHHEDLQVVSFKEQQPERTFNIGTRLKPDHQKKLMELIRRVDPEISLHNLHLDPSYKPVKQKKRNFSEEKNLAIREEVDELIKAGAIRELEFLEWIANVVMVKKSNVKWRMCKGFTNLNKACPKDYYPLPCLGRLVYRSAGHKVFDFLDASRGYHQIVLLGEDQEKMPFITEYRLYCWKTGRLTKWAIELSEFEITFVPKTGVKAQALAAFIIECTTRDSREGQEYVAKLPERPHWILYVGASNPKRSGAGILIQGPEGLQFDYALRFSFKTTNNEAEYEAMVTWLLLAQSLSITRVVVRGDSKLVIEQIRGDYGVKSESLQKYHAKVTSLTTRFDYLIFEHTPRQENEYADHLSRLATTYYEDNPLGVHIEHRERPIYEEVRIYPMRLVKEDWRSPIIKFLTTRELPEEKIKARKL
ncbi:hypothetical protein LIER_19020 [Lithospermum erythrorhizon]|uniref:RNase H type-1 domain-containing protein n=1 Tax=Lithospermum erythrorhizon TaxID=34254 RepID=A0AAV3QK48_LITER